MFFVGSPRINRGHLFLFFIRLKREKGSLAEVSLKNYLLYILVRYY